MVIFESITYIKRSLIVFSKFYRTRLPILLNQKWIHKPKYAAASPELNSKKSRTGMMQKFFVCFYIFIFWTQS